MRPYDVPVSHERVPREETREGPASAYLMLDAALGAVVGVDAPAGPADQVALVWDATLGAALAQQPVPLVTVALRRYGVVLTA